MHVYVYLVCNNGRGLHLSAFHLYGYSSCCMHLRHVILAHVGYYWHMAVDLGYTQLCHF